MSKNRIIPQMFDVRPVDETGDLDWKKIQSIGGRTECIGDDPFRRDTETESSADQNLAYDSALHANTYILGTPLEIKDVPVLHQSQFETRDFCVGDESSGISFEGQQTAEQRRREDFVNAQAVAQQEELKRIAEYNRQQQAVYESTIALERESREREHAEWLKKEMEAERKARKFQDEIAQRSKKVSKKAVAGKKWIGSENNLANFSWRDVFSPPRFSFQFDASSASRGFVFTALAVLLSVGGVAYASKGLSMRGKVLGVSSDGYANLSAAVSDIAHQNFEGSSAQFAAAYENFAEGSAQLNSMGGLLLDATRFVPFASKVSSGKNAIEAGKHFSAAGKALNEVAKVASQIKNPIDGTQQSDSSLLDVFKVAQENIAVAKNELDLAQQNMDRISIDDLPEDKRDKFLTVKQQLPTLRSALDLFLNNSHIFADLLGGNGPRKYLFLFQNNSEMRATGGFIGTYGLLDIANGHIKKFFIDGIFNPDGQLKEKIVPPIPIQKISTNWSMHDSNWFANFPTSARKAIQFYEKTGGPTADGVITLTPTVMQKLLEITGPIEMSEYGVTLDSKNFIELTQFEVEVDYDKQENKPKKILSDLAPIVLEKLLSSKDVTIISKTAQAFLDGLNEKHILLYSENTDLEKIISKQGWSGEVLSASKDYISVINTNVNGFKTDSVVEEKIQHSAQIQADGSVVDTVTITRKHNGGSSQYEWLNKVNADYMRVYVPLGSKLLEVSGQTREVDKPPVDYDALGFKRDADMLNQESNTVIDPASGTSIFEEAGKTVFANWTYVSPQETMTITYKYLLPFTLFKLSIENEQQIDSYSLVAQKQAGSLGSAFVSEITYPENYNIEWNFPLEGNRHAQTLKTETKLDADRFLGIVFKKNQN